MRELFFLVFQECSEQVCLTIRVSVSLCLLWMCRVCTKLWVPEGRFASGTVTEGSRHVPCCQVWHDLHHHEVPAVHERAVRQGGAREEHDGRSDGNFGGIQCCQLWGVNTKLKQQPDILQEQSLILKEKENSNAQLSFCLQPPYICILSLPFVQIHLCSCGNN